MSIGKRMALHMLHNECARLSASYIIWYFRHFARWHRVLMPPHFSMLRASPFASRRYADKGLMRGSPPRQILIVIIASRRRRHAAGTPAPRLRYGCIRDYTPFLAINIDASALFIFALWYGPDFVTHAWRREYSMPHITMLLFLRFCWCARCLFHFAYHGAFIASTTLSTISASELLGDRLSRPAGPLDYFSFLLRSIHMQAPRAKQAILILILLLAASGCRHMIFPLGGISASAHISPCANFCAWYWCHLSSLGITARFAASAFLYFISDGGIAYRLFIL